MHNMMVEARIENDEVENATKYNILAETEFQSGNTNYVNEAGDDGVDPEAEVYHDVFNCQYKCEMAQRDDNFFTIVVVQRGKML